MSGRDRFLKVSEVGALTGLSERTIRAMLADGRLRAVRPAGLRVVRVSEAEIKRLMRPTQRPGRTGKPVEE